MILTATIDEINVPMAEAMVEHLKKLTGDASLTLKRIEKGSVRLIIDGSREAFEMLRGLVRAGNLSSLSGFPIQGIEKNSSTMDAVSSELFSEQKESYNYQESEEENIRLRQPVQRVSQSSVYALSSDVSEDLVQTRATASDPFPLSTTANAGDLSEIFQTSSAQPSFLAPEPEPEPIFVSKLRDDLQVALGTSSITDSGNAIVRRIAIEVERICAKSDRIQNSGDVQSWKMTLAQHRLRKMLTYYNLGSRQGRVELHSHLSAVVYRHISRGRARFGFQARYNMIEDFLQGFYIEVLKVFRKENRLPADYSPRTRLQLSEYMAFTEHYANRRINLPGRRNQQLIVLRAQGFAKRQPEETLVDNELVVGNEEAEAQDRSSVLHQVREQMVADAVDLSDSVLRDRVVGELVQYLESQSQEDCINYLTLKLQDLSAPEIDEILDLTPRQRDYLQQRFKYHVEKFARSHRWQLVHQWLGADLDQNLGMPPQKWSAFLETLTPEQQNLVQLKSQNTSDTAIAKTLKCTPRQVERRWVKVLEQAWQFRNSETELE